MLQLCSVALLVVASGLVAAPAPVYRVPVSPKTPYEVMRDALRETGKASGPYPTEHGTWTLTAGKVNGDHLEKVVLTFSNSDGKRWHVMRTDQARIRVKQGKTGVLILNLCEGHAEGGMRTHPFPSTEIELFTKP